MSSPPRSGGAEPLWAPCILAAIAWGGAVLMALAHGLHWTYQPWGGVLGHPTYLDYAPFQEKFYYMAGLGLTGALGILFGAWTARARHGLALALGLASSGVVAAGIVALLWHNPAGHLVKTIIRDPMALIETLALGLLMLVLIAGGAIFPQAPAGPEASEAPALLAHRGRVIADDWAAMLGRWVPAFLLVLLLGVAFIPVTGVSLALAAVFAFAFEWVLRPVEKTRQGLNITVFLEAAAWFTAGIVLPSLGWWMRLRISKGQGLPDPRVPVLVLFIVLGLILLTGMVRRRLRLAPLVHPAWLILPAAFTLTVLGTGAIGSYDAFHEGEFIYSAHAMRNGLLPWHDIFYVHGFGANTLLGWLAGPPNVRMYTLDIVLICLVGAFSAVFNVWLLLGMWGWRWWLLVLLNVVLCCGYSPTPRYRYLVFWVVLLLVMGFLKRERLRWLGLAGAATVGACLYSLDLGSALVIALPVWLLLWHGWQPGGVFAHRRAVHWLMPMAAWLLGLTVAGLVFLAWLWAHGMVADFIGLHLEYLRAKSHADKIPFELNSLTVLFSPLVSLLGILASALILRRGDRTPLAGFIVLMTVINALVFTRALDRADAGHIVYVCVPSWVLLGSLVAWRCREVATAATLTRETLARSAMLGLFILVIPYLSPALLDQRGPRASLTLPLIEWIRFYPQSVRQGFVRPPEDKITRDFFALAAQLRKIVKPADGFYDFSNQPAIYAWTDTTSPTRFYATYYAYSERWQDEVVDALESKRVRWVLWKGPNPFFNAPDGVPNYIRQWDVACYILAHYRPAYRLAGDSLLAERVGWEGEAPPADRPAIERDWVRLKWIPLVWGRGTAGVPPVLPHVAWSLDEATSGGRLVVRPPADIQPGQPGAAGEVLLAFEPAVDGTCEILWWGAAKGYLNFNLRANDPGPYRVTLDNLPDWVWGAPIDDMQIKVATDPPTEPPRDVRVRLEFRR